MHSDDFKYSDHHEHSFVRVEPDDPNRCQAVTQKGQCMFKAMEGSNYCTMHGAKVNPGLRNYHLSKFRQKMATAANQPEIKSLRDEIGILRVLIEERINSCTDPMDLMMQSNTISDLVMKVKATVEACHKLEEKLGALMDREQAIAFAMAISDIISKHVADSDILQLISEEITELVASKIT